jgi:hypothetical protein
VHEIFVSTPSGEPVAFHDLQRAESAAERLCMLAGGLSLLALGRLGELAIEQQSAGNELGPTPRPFRDPVAYLPRRPRLITDAQPLADAIVDIWRQQKAIGLEHWETLGCIHHELFAGRELTPVDYAAVEAAHWGIYRAGSNIHSPQSWHMMLRGGSPPRHGWCEPWPPAAQRSASERYASNPKLESLLPGARIPADADPEALRRQMPFAFSEVPVEVFVELLNDVGPPTVRMVLHGCDKSGSAWWRDPQLMLDELLAPHRPRK